MRNAPLTLLAIVLAIVLAITLGTAVADVLSTTGGSL